MCVCVGKYIGIFLIDFFCYVATELRNRIHVIDPNYSGSRVRCCFDMCVHTQKEYLDGVNYVFLHVL